MGVLVLISDLKLKDRALALGTDISQFLEDRSTSRQYGMNGQHILMVNSAVIDPYDAETERHFRKRYGTGADTLWHEFALKNIHDADWDASRAWKHGASGNATVLAAINGLRSCANILDRQ